MAESMESREEIKSDEISLVDLFAICIKHKIIILFVTTIAALISLLFVIGSLILPNERSYLPNIYSPKAVMLISSNGSGGLSSMLGGSTASLAALAGVNIGGGKSNGQLAVLLAKSSSTLDELNGNLDLSIRYKIKKNIKTATRKAISKKLVVTYDEKTTTCTVSFTDRDPVLAQTVVNKVVEILDRRFSTLGGSKALETQKRLETKLADVNTQISILESRAKTFVAKYGVLDVDAMATEQVTVLAKLRSELIMKDMEIENYEKFSKIDDPVIKRLRSERESFSAKINEIEKGQTLLPGQKEIPKLSFEYAELKRDLMVQEEMYKLLIQQYEMAKFSAESQEPAFQVLELAEVPDQKSGPSRTMICIVATFASFFVSILIVFLLEAIKNVRNDPVAMKKLRGEV
jgi:tyrosine-protein kinase Etk/Wzc